MVTLMRGTLARPIKMAVWSCFATQILQQPVLCRSTSRCTPYPLAKSEMQPSTVGHPEDISSSLTEYPLYCVFKGPHRGCWKDFDDIRRMMKAYRNSCSFAKVYTKTEAEWTLNHSESFKTLLATVGSVGEFQKILEDIFAGHEEIRIGDELQAAIYSRASQAPAPSTISLVSPTPSPVPSPSFLSVAEMTRPSQLSQPPQADHRLAYNMVSYPPSSPVARPAQDLSKEPVWPGTQRQSPHPHRTLIKGSVASALRRHSVAEEATRRFRIFQKPGGGNPAFELDVAYELQTKLRALIRQLEDDLLDMEDGELTPSRSWY
ncbi:hypothetical protein FS749_001501 [Ceratobasidium sp. UAMH 11750]|nr:hypothetical protein FS749_001501 [Ceratobasidium sp. UAMH 11750]